TLLMHALYVGLLALYAGWAVFGVAVNLGSAWFGFPWLPPNGSYSVPLLAGPGLMWAYRKGSAKTVALYAPLLAWWVILLPIAWRFEVNPIDFIGCVGGLFLIVAESHREGSVMAVPYRFYGVLLTAGILVPLSYYEINREMQARSPGLPGGLLVEM